jgi:hypothetical protein
MLVVQMTKVLLSNQYTVLVLNRSFNDNGDVCLEICFAGYPQLIPTRYQNQRIERVYPDKNGAIIIEMEN